jgi:uroporphyrin-III C-methyltransferase/precorrin-2 dehydrogenase/sirohydrochlorin ferrochelatase
VWKIEEEAMSLLPVFLKLDGRRCLLVGAGSVALDKIDSLLRTGLRLCVVAPEARPEIRQMALQNKLEWVERSFELADLDGNFLAIAATDSPEVNARVYRGAVERNILANSVDDTPDCNFFFGSVVRRGSLQVAVSTSGESPAFAQRLRREIDAQLPEDLGAWLENLGRLRREVLEQHPRGEDRKLLLHELAQRRVCESESCPSRQMALASLEESDSGTAILDEPAGDFGFLPEAGASFSAETVHLVGAGPGDPDLLTVKAVRLIQTADVILHDDLVPQAILDLASPSAEIVNVGKRCGTKNITQHQINVLMIAHARAGRSVVRLKNGDPLLFGRAAEEMTALAEADVPFLVVPGISAAFAAAAAVGCSLTDRNQASSVVFSTGHHAQPHDGLLPRLEDATRVVYMPGRDLNLLAEEWLEQGFPPDLPCAIVSRAAQSGQRVLRTTLGALGQAAPTLAPSLLIAGRAVGEVNATKQRAAEQTTEKHI